MKTTRMQAVKRDWNVVSRGSRNSIRVLVRWINATTDKDIVKRRLLITAGVPCGFIFLGSKYPVIAVAGSFVLLIGCVFWFARVEERAMTFHVLDFEGAFQVGSRVMDFSELLAYLAGRHPDLPLSALGDIICDDFHGPDLDDVELALQMRRHGIRHPAVADPSPIGPSAPSSGDESPGQGVAEGAPEGVPSPQGRGKAELGVMRFIRSASGYAGFSKEKEKPDEERREEPAQPDADRLGPQARSGPDGPGESRDEGDRRHESGAAGLHGGEGSGAPDPGRVPGSDGQHPEAHEATASGTEAAV